MVRGPGSTHNLRGLTNGQSCIQVSAGVKYFVFLLNKSFIRIYYAKFKTNIGVAIKILCGTFPKPNTKHSHIPFALQTQYAAEQKPTLSREQLLWPITESLYTLNFPGLQVE